MTEEKKEPVKPKPLCYPCRYKLIQGAGYKQTDPWMTLEIVATLTLVNCALKDNRFLIKYGNDVYGVNRIQCLGCFMPQTLNKIRQVAKETRDMEKIKAIGDGEASYG